MHNSKIKRISLAVCLALMPYAANAAGLGKLTVFSGLGEPLNAEIELSATKDELSSLTAKIASTDTYSEQGLQRPAILGNLQLEIGQQANGNPVLKLRSPSPIDDPFLDMLIQVEWSNGRLLREYTALLDPPGFGEKVDSAAKPPQVAAESTSVPSAGKSTQKTGKSGRTATAKPTAPQEHQGDGYKTRSGDTLRSIAKDTLVEGVSLDQMLVGLYRANPDAFVNGNMNRLKTGQILRVPSAEDVQAVTQQEAVKEIRVHASDWNSYRQKLAGAVTEAEGESAQAQSASGKITAPAEDKGAKAPEGPRDVVKLSKGDATSKATGPESAAVAKDDAIAQQKASKEADARIASLEKQLQDMQKLLEVKNRDLASLQKPQAGQTTPAPTPAPAQPVATAPVAEVKPVPVEPPAPAETKPVEAKPAEVVPPPAATEVKPAEPPKPKRAKRPPPVFDEPAAEPDLLEDPVVLGGAGGGLIALLAGGWLYLRNKRRRGLDSFEQGILTTSGLKPNTVFGNTAGGMVDTGDTSFLTDLSQGGGGMIDTNDVDPIAEAEVYMAYGRDVQAEEILKDAIVKEPRRYELHQKLLEIYSNRKDTTAFETLAGELYATLGPTDPTWQKFAAMGHALEPANPLYLSDGAPVAAAVNAASTQEFPAASFSSTEMDQGQVVDTGTEVAFDAPEAAVADNGLDFDLGSVEEAGAADTNEVDSAALDTTILEEVPQLPEATDSAPAMDQGLDFSFELPEPALEQNVQLDAADIGLDADTPSAATEAFAGLDVLPELEIPADDTDAAAQAPATNDIALDLPELSLGSSEEPSDQSDALEGPDAGVETMLELPEAVIEAVPEVAAEDIGIALDVPEIDIELPAEPETVTAAGAESLDTVELELPSLDMDASQAEDMDKTMVFQAPVAEAEEIVFESAPAEDTALDFNFDTEFGVPAAEETETADTVSTAGLPDLDLSGISLDLDEPAMVVEPAAEETVALDLPEVEDIALDAVAEDAPVEEISLDAPSEAVEEITLSGSESADVDTKLDLVAAYMDMGDTEGARELLEEVLREGGPQQRERAQGLLDSLG